jgi:hypothetical protein
MKEYYKNIPPLFIVTADEYYKRPMKFSIPDYLKSYLNNSASSYFLFAALFALFLEAIFFWPSLYPMRASFGSSFGPQGQ